MRSFLCPTNIFIIGTYLVLSAIPFVPALLGRTVEDPAHIIAIEFIAWMTAWAVFKRPAWFHWLLLPAFLALPIELYLNAYYNQGISTHHLGIIAETNPRESLEFLGDRIWLFAIAVFSVVLRWWLSWKAARSTLVFDWNGHSRC